MDFSKEFVKDDKISELWIKTINDTYTMFLWAGDSAHSNPNIHGLLIEQYSHFEIAIYFWAAPGTQRYPTDLPVGNCLKKTDLANLNIDLSPWGYDQTWHASFIAKIDVETIINILNKDSCGNTAQPTAKSFNRFAAAIDELVNETAGKSKGKPCKQCGKPNDIGVSFCWWCEVKSPTA